MTPEDIQKYCPKAENITVFPDGSVGMRVGLFSQAVNVGYNKDKQLAQRQIKNLYLDLLAMNRSTERQISDAKQEADKWQT